MSWIKKGQLEFNNSLYVTVECNIKEEEKCSYSMKFSGHDNGIMKSSVINYKYYVSKYNKEMKFTIANDLDTSSPKGVLTVTAIGGKNINLILTDKSGNKFENYNNYKTGSAIIGSISNDSPYFNLTVEAEEGYYITIGSKITVGEKSDINVLKPNGHEINGYLERDTLDKECYLIPDANNEINFSYIVATFNSSAQISYRDRLRKHYY